MNDEIHYFCDAKYRPECLKGNNLCCLHCDVIIKCQEINKKIKPCTADVVCLDEPCEFAI